MAINRKLSALLDSFASRQSTVEKLNMDPIVFPMRYADLRDKEITALIAASFAFGKVSAILNALEQVLTPLGSSPTTTLQETNEKQLKELYPDFRYRFVNREGLVAFLSGIRKILLTSGNLTAHVKRNNPVKTADSLFRELLSGSGNKKALLASNLLANPMRGGPAKRWMLFLRWMVRNQFPDFGIWKHLISPSRLIIPLDTHILRISRYLGFTRKSSPSMKVALEITDALAQLSPDDPLRFDYAIAHLGIDGFCPGRREFRHCDICPLQEFCLEGRMSGNIK